MRPHHQHHSLDNPCQPAPHLDIPLSAKARRAICERIGHSRICIPASSESDLSYSCGRCGIWRLAQRTPESPEGQWRLLVCVHYSGRLCSFCLEAYAGLRWHDWLFLLPGVASTTLGAMERAATSSEEHY